MLTWNNDATSPDQTQAHADQFSATPTPVPAVASPTAATTPSSTAMYSFFKGLAQALQTHQAHTP